MDQRVARIVRLIYRDQRNPKQAVRSHCSPRIPNVRNWAVRDYGNRVGIWRIMELLTRYGIRASAALNSEVCDHHPEIIEEAGRLG